MTAETPEMVDLVAKAIAEAMGERDPLDPKFLSDSAYGDMARAAIAAMRPTDSMLFPLQEQALSVLSTYVERRKVIDKANRIVAKAVQTAGDDFSGLYLPGMDGAVLTHFCDLLDAIWEVPGSGLASYYLHECVGPLGHGGGVECGHGTWILRDIGELRAYLEHCQVCDRGAKVAS